MRCDRCHGSGEVLVWVGLQKDGTLFMPTAFCPVCNGSGITSCCDGVCGDDDKPVERKLRDGVGADK